MDICALSSRKRPRTCGRYMFEEDLDNRISAVRVADMSIKGIKRRKRDFFTYQLVVCLGVLLVQLVRVHAWSPSSSSITKKSTPSAVMQNPSESYPLSWPFLVDRPSIPSSDLLSSRYLIHDRANTKFNSNNAMRMMSSLPSNHRSYVPSMLIGDDFFFPIRSNDLGAGRSSSDSVSIGKGNKSGQADESSPDRREGRVLGFDVFELHAKRPESSGSEELSGDDSPSGLTWKNDPLSRAVNDDRGGSSPTVTQLTAWTSSFSKKSIHPNADVRLLKYSSPLLPAWFPWVPTKSQIMTLKLKELREACSQRGLAKAGNKDVLQERLWEWTIEHQTQHQARLNGDFLSSNFEQDDNDLKSFLREHKKQEDGIDESGLEESTNTPNSLAEWSRSIDTEKLTQKRQEIHRQKRVGKKTSTFGESSSSSFTRNNNYKNKNNRAEDPAATKEYLTKLSNAMKTSPSSPYASNRDVKELYYASKKADQLGEPFLAIDLLESLVKLTPNDARIYRRLSRMHNDRGNLDKARATLQEGLRKLPHNQWLWHGLGQLELSQGRTEYAIRCFQRAIQEDPAFAHPYHAWGIHEFNNGQIAKAMKILKKGIEYCPTNHRLHHALGDLYRGAKLPRDAERSYRRALEEGPPVSHSFALSALASVAYEQGNVDEARRWLYQSIGMNNGRHAQGWLALAEIEEAEGNVEEALKVCEASIIRYENELVESRKRYKKDSEEMNNHRDRSNKRKQPDQRELLDIAKSFMDPTKVEEVERGLLKSIPKYRSGDKFVNVFRHWARLEGRYGTYDGCNRVYERASQAFPLDHKIPLDWARYHVNIRSYRLARRHFAEACTIASTKDAEPYREYASYEMMLGEYEQARKILFQGAQAVTRSDDGGTGSQNQVELPRLYVTWAVCEWHLQNFPRAEVLFDHALRLTKVGTEEGSELRSFILFCIAKLKYSEGGELHRAQHCIGLCLKENSFPGGNAPVWNLWAKIARGLDNSRLEEKCLHEANLCKVRLEDLNDDEEGGSSALDTMDMLKGSENIQDLMRQKPWFDKLQAIRMSDDNDSSLRSSSSQFFSSIQLPTFENRDARSERIMESYAEPQVEKASFAASDGMQ